MFYNILPTIRSKKGPSFLPEDKDRIFEVVKKEVGFGELDALVFRVFEQRMMDALKEQLRSS